MALARKAAKGTGTGLAGLAAGPGAFASRTMPLPQLQPPGAGEVHAWYLDLDLLGAPLQSALGGPGAEPQDRLPATQRRFARRFYLRLLLGAYLGLPGKDVSLVRSVRGKPVLDRAAHRGGLEFSMAKSEGRVLVGVCVRDAIGVDLEPVARKPHNAMRVAQRYFHPAEAGDLGGFDAGWRDAAFLRAWACKEAVVKASGQGIANQLCRFRIEMDPARPAAMLEFEDDDPAAWSLALIQPDRDYVGAVAVRQPRLELRCFRLLPAGA